MSPTTRPRNALKHGGYANLGVLPGEDPVEFDRFHQSLVDEFEPSGPTEDDVVLSLAKCLWRKARLQIYAYAAKAREEWAEVFGPNAPTPCAEDNLNLLVYKAVKAAAEGQESERSRRRRARIEIILASRKYTSKMVELGGEMSDEETEELERRSTTHALAQLGTLVTHEALIQEIELEARLDSRIDRLLKRLFQLKAAKPMVGLGPRSEKNSEEDRMLNQGSRSTALKVV